MSRLDGHTEPSTTPTLELGPHASLRLLTVNAAADDIRTGDADSRPRMLLVELRVNPPQGADTNWKRRFAGIGSHLYAEIEGLGRSPAEILDNDAVSTEDAIRCRLRFTFSAGQIATIRAGADLGFGVNDERMRVGVRVKGQARRQLLAL